MTGLPCALLLRVVLAQTGKEKRKTVPAPLRLTPVLLGGKERANAFGACTFKSVFLLINPNTQCPPLNHIFITDASLVLGVGGGGIAKIVSYLLCFLFKP